MNKIIFLDIDGVMNTEREIVRRVEELGSWPNYEDNFSSFPFDPEAMKELDRIIDETDAKIVISSSWRLGSTVEELRKVFKIRGVKHWDKIIDKTPYDNSHRDRGIEISEWVLENEVEKFVILDDDTFDITPHHYNHVVFPCNPRTGLIKSISEKIIALFLA